MTAHAHDHSHDKVSFGFWTYILTDILLFATLFATYAALRPSAEMLGLPGPKQLFNMPFVLAETMLLLTSSLTLGLAMLGRQSGSLSKTLTGLAITWVLGFAFISMELYEFVHLIHSGNGPTTSAFMSGFFGLVGTHGLHVLVGLIWIAVLWVQLFKKGLGVAQNRRLMTLSLFWHFLDIIWIFVFTFVYLMGVI